MELTEKDRRLIRALLEGLPVTERPFLEVAGRAGLSEAEVTERLGAWKRSGLLRRICVYIRHREAGFTANGLAAWAVPPERLDEVGLRMAESPAVTHCYARRPHRRFPYNLYAMLHGRSRDEVLAEVRRLAALNGLDGCRVLFSTREFKRSTAELVPEDNR